MKILEAQSAILTNYEVQQHLLEQRDKHKLQHKQYQANVRQRDKAKDKASVQLGPRVDKRPGNLETIVRELLEYFDTAPSPLACKPHPYNSQTIKNLLAALRPWDFTKAEVIMIINLRPTKPEILNTIVEQMEDRFPGDDVQLAICRVITAVLGSPNSHSERLAMTEGAAEARKELHDLPVESMETD